MFFKVGGLNNFAIFKRKHESLFNKVAGLQLSCEYCKNFKNSFFHKTPPVAASEKFKNFPGNISDGGVIDFNVLLKLVNISHFHIT